MTKKLKSGTPFVYDENDRVVGIRDPHTGTDTDLVTAVTSPGGGMRIGGRELAYKGSPQWRKLPNSVKETGEKVTDFGFDGATISTSALGVAGSTVRRDVVTLPDGSRKTALVVKVVVGGYVYVDIDITPQSLDLIARVGVRLFIPGNQTGVDVRAVLSNDNFVTSKRASLLTDFSALFANGFVDVRFPVAQMTNVGAVNDAVPFSKIRIELSNTVGLRSFGEVALLEVTTRKKEVPRFIFTTDDGTASDLWLAAELAKYGMKLTSYIITDSSKAGGGYGAMLTWEQVAQLAAMPNVQVGSHTHNHISANGLKTEDQHGARSTALSLSASFAAGAVALNGAIGVASFDMPRCVTISTTGTPKGWDTTIVGKYQGNDVTEVVRGSGTDVYPRATTAVFDRVTSITHALNGATATGTIQYGVSASYAEMHYELTKSFEELESRGIITERHYAHPYGMTNTIVDQVLADLGVRTARGVSQEITGLEKTSNFYGLPAVQWDAATYAKKSAHISWVINGGNTIIVYFHEIPAGTQKRTDVAEIIAAVGALVQSGEAESLHVGDLWAESVT